MSRTKANAVQRKPNHKSQRTSASALQAERVTLWLTTASHFCSDNLTAPAIVRLSHSLSVNSMLQVNSCTNYRHLPLKHKCSQIADTNQRLVVLEARVSVLRVLEFDFTSLCLGRPMVWVLRFMAEVKWVGNCPGPGCVGGLGQANK